MGREMRKGIKILRPKIHLGGPIECMWHLFAMQRGPCRHQCGESRREEMAENKVRRGLLVVEGISI